MIKEKSVSEASEDCKIIENRPTGEIKYLCLTEKQFKWSLGLFIVVGIGISWVGATQFTQDTFSGDFNAPFFTNWFKTNWTIVCYPVYYLPKVLFFRRRQWKKVLKEDERVFGEGGLTLKSFFLLVGFFCFLWVITNYMYTYALGEIAASDVTAIFSSNTAFVFVLSILILGEHMLLLRIIAVAFSITGIVLMAYEDGFKGANVTGILLTVGSAIAAALYKVLFKKILGFASLGQVSLFLSALGFMNLVFLWPVVLILYYTNVEIYEWSNIPWDYFCGSAAFGVVYNFLINFGIAFTYPLFIAIGTVIGVPLNAVVDYLKNDIVMGGWKIFGAVLIISGFIILLLPEEIQSVFSFSGNKSKEKEIDKVPREMIDRSVQVTIL